MAKLIGEENTLLIYKEFRGSQISFPMRLVSNTYIGEIAESEFTGNNLQELAKKYGYSERHLRRLIKIQEEHGRENQ